MGEKEAIEKLMARGMSRPEAEKFVDGIKRGIEARNRGDIKAYADIAAEITEGPCPGCEE
jgi:uncharacterized protein YoaH (UPF0181 family)